MCRLQPWTSITMNTLWHVVVYVKEVVLGFERESNASKIVCFELDEKDIEISLYLKSRKNRGRD